MIVVVFIACVTAQFVDHVHFHVIPKPSDSDEEGLVVGWPQTTPEKEDLAAVQAELLTKL
jgi:diadenosine tetraphosphate (Ap4A) HIT family hydrolase